MADELSFEVTPRVRDSCLCLHVQRAARAVARRYDEALRPLGLTNGQFSLMMALNVPKPPRLSRVSAVLAMDRTTLTAALKPLVRRGLVELVSDPEDRRSRRPKLTPAGRRLLSEAMPIWEQTLEAIRGRLEGSDVERLLAELRALS
jgi:DNA-binding MarR family transcriptional regulator